MLNNKEQLTVSLLLLSSIFILGLHYVVLLLGFNGTTYSEIFTGLYLFFPIILIPIPSVIFRLLKSQLSIGDELISITGVRLYLVVFLILIVSFILFDFIFFQFNLDFISEYGRSLDDLIEDDVSDQDSLSNVPLSINLLIQELILFLASAFLIKRKIK
jgi:hypothetical protein